MLSTATVLRLTAPTRACLRVSALRHAVAARTFGAVAPDVATTTAAAAAGAKREAVERAAASSVLVGTAQPVTPSTVVPLDVERVMVHPVYTMEYLESIAPRHREPKDLTEKLAYNAIQAVRGTFDTLTGYGPNMTEAKWLLRIIYLESVAGVPGMVGGMLRHLRSLRLMRKDNGWINTLLQEAENERMHLLTFMGMQKPSPMFRAMLLATQGVFWNIFFVGYVFSPRFCHSLVGYLEEEAVKTYTHALEDVDAGRVWKDQPAPEVASSYWRLAKGATMRDLLLAVRADEASHSHVNHTLSELPADAPCPFGQETHLVP